ncbi:MAG: hypothetical protein IKO41_00255 [Lachnospiraceae bacterium]|nr:hypothetical protein [Lachnospiraceae bacterium]
MALKDIKREVEKEAGRFISDDDPLITAMAMHDKCMEMDCERLRVIFTRYLTDFKSIVADGNELATKTVIETVDTATKNFHAVFKRILNEYSQGYMDRFDQIIKEHEQRMNAMYNEYSQRYASMTMYLLAAGLAVFLGGVLYYLAKA